MLRGGLTLYVIEAKDLTKCFNGFTTVRQREERVEEVLKLVRLSQKADELVKNYSRGMGRRLEIARGLIHNPKVLFLDEPHTLILPSLYSSNML